MFIFQRFIQWALSLRRQWIQLGAAAVFNSYFLAPWAKALPCPGFNCYACPLAITACPIGSLQHFVILRRVPLYLLGFLGVIGALAGRMACGWVCPFGYLQEQLYKLPVPKWRISNRLARFRYLIFAVLVIAIPFATYEPWFCKLCPAGGLEAGAPLAILNAEIRALAGLLFLIKMLILALFLIWFAVTTRPFCRFVCPLGSIYAPFNAVSGVKLYYDGARCLRCDDCADVCPTALHPPTEIDSEGCIRCLECLKACPQGALSAGPAHTETDEK